MLEWLTGYSFYTQSPHSTTATQHEPQALNPVTEMFEKKLQDMRNLQRCSLSQLNQLYVYLLEKDTSKDDPRVQKITTLIEQKITHIPPLSACIRSLASTEKEEDQTKLYGYDLSIEELKKIIDESGDQLVEIVLFVADDELITKIAEKCVHLTSFKLSSGPIFPGVGPIGIAAIGKMTNLTSLEIGSFCFMDYSPEDIRNLLSQPHFQENLINLNIAVFDCSDSVFPPIANYKNLQQLTLVSGYDYNLMPLLQSPLLQKTVTQINLKDVYKITDEVIQSLKAFKLEHLEMTLVEEFVGEQCWFVASKELQSLLTQYGENLKTLRLGEKVTVNTNTMQTILTLNNLEALVVDNCKEIEPYNGAFDSLQKMTHLEILTLRQLGKKGEVFGSVELYHLADLPLEKLTLSFNHDNGASLEGWMGFAQGEVAKTLKSLQIEGINSAAIRGDAYAQFLGYLSLEALRIIDCGWINDDMLNVLEDTPLSRNLEKLEIRGNAFSSNAINFFSKYPKLKVLGLLENDGMTSDAGINLVNNETLKQNLQGLLIGDINMDLEVMLKLVKFDQLQILITACNAGISEEQEKDVQKACREGLIYLPDGVEDNRRYDSLLKMMKLLYKQSHG